MTAPDDLGTPSRLLGDAAITLHRVAYTLDSLRSRLTAYGPGFFETEQRAQPYEDLEGLGEEMDALTEHLSAKLGAEHGAVAALAAARAAVRDIVGTLGVLKDPDPGEVRDPQKVADQAMERIEAQRASFDDRRDRFMDARDSPGDG